MTERLNHNKWEAVRADTLQAAAAKGTEEHLNVELHLNGKLRYPGPGTAVAAARDLLAPALQAGARLWRTEYPLSYKEEDGGFSLHGTCDLCLLNPDGSISIWDWKHSQGLKYDMIGKAALSKRMFAPLAGRSIADIYCLQLSGLRLCAERAGFVVRDLVCAGIHPAAPCAFRVEYDRAGAEQLVHMARIAKLAVSSGASVPRLLRCAETYRCNWRAAQSTMTKGVVIDSGAAAARHEARGKDAKHISMLACDWLRTCADSACPSGELLPLSCRVTRIDAGLEAGAIDAMTDDEAELQSIEHEAFSTKAMDVDSQPSCESPCQRESVLEALPRQPYDGPQSAAAPDQATKAAAEAELRGVCVALFSNAGPAFKQAVGHLFDVTLKLRGIAGGLQQDDDLARATQTALKQKFTSAIAHENPTAASRGDHAFPVAILASWPRCDQSTTGVALRHNGINSVTLRVHMMMCSIIKGGALSQDETSQPWSVAAMEDICSLQDPMPPSADGYVDCKPEVQDAAGTLTAEQIVTQLNEGKLHRGSGVLLVQGAHTGGSLVKRLLAARSFAVAVEEVPVAAREAFYHKVVGEKPVVLTQLQMLIVATHRAAVVVCQMNSGSVDVLGVRAQFPTSQHYSAIMSHEHANEVGALVHFGVAVKIAPPCM